MATLDREIHLLVRRLARRGLLEYRLGNADDDKDRVVVEPQISDYWPQPPTLDDTDVIVLSRFAYLRRRGNEMVLESPRAGALFRICDPKIAAAVAMLSTPRAIKQFRRQDGFPGLELLALLVDCQILFKIDAEGGDGLRPSEGGDKLVLWDFHDLLFHTHSTAGRQANPLGGLYPYADTMPAPPAVRDPLAWKENRSGQARERLFGDRPRRSQNCCVHVIQRATSTINNRSPCRNSHSFSTALRACSRNGKTGSTSTAAVPRFPMPRGPIPPAGSAYELELYLSVANCEGLARGFYHYDADRHALVPIDAGTAALDAQLAAAEFAMDAAGVPQILITIAARFDRTLGNTVRSPIRSS